MGRDGLKSTHPIEAKVKDPDEIEELFDEISYGKGASILRMIEAYIGPDIFRKGVAKYLEKFRYSNAAGSDLWSHLQEASGTEVNRIMQGWISKSGFPVVTASLNGSKLLLSQERFLLAGGIEKHSWPVPVTMNVDGKVQRMLLDKEKGEANVGSPKSLKLNVDQTGFYLVRYQGKELQDLVWNSKLSPLDKWGLISDAKAFLLSGHMSVKEFLGIAERFENESEYLPAFELSDQFEFLYCIAPEKMAGPARRVQTKLLKTLHTKKDENSSLLRGIVASRLVLLDDEFAKQQGSHLNNIASVEPDMKLPVIKGYARSTNDYDGLIDRFKKSTTDEERLRYLDGLSSFKKPELVAKALDFTIGGNVKRQDIRNVILYTTENPDAKKAEWDWFKNNFQKLIDIYQGTAQLSSTLRGNMSVVGVGRVGDVESLFRQHPVPGADATIERLRIFDRLAKSINAEL